MGGACALLPTSDSNTSEAALERECSFFIECFFFDEDFDEVEGDDDEGEVEGEDALRKKETSGDDFEVSTLAALLPFDASCNDSDVNKTDVAVVASEVPDKSTVGDVDVESAGGCDRDRSRCSTTNRV